MTLTLGAAFALSAAFFWALGGVLVKKGLQGGSVSMAQLVGIITNIVILWPAAILTLGSLDVAGNLIGILYFAIAGVTNTALGRFFRYISIERMGVAASAPISSAYPLFASLFAVLILGEVVTVEIGLGIGLIVGGIVLLSPFKGGTLRRRGAIFAVLSAILFGLGDNFRKLGIILISNAPLGAAIGSSMALPLHGPYFLAFGDRKVTRHSLIFFILSGVSHTLALTSIFIALSLADVVVAVPLGSTIPLFAQLLTFFLLRDVEKITIQTVIASILVVLGITVIVAL